MRLANKVVIITGGAKGIGRGTAVRLAREGARIVIGDIDSDSGLKTAEDVKKLGAAVRFVEADVSRVEDVKRLVQETLDAFGGVDVLHSNAAYLQDFRPVLETTEAEWEKALAVSLKGGFLCSKEVLPQMIKRGKGSIIFTASILSHVVIPGYAAYSVAKGGLLQLMRSLALDYGRHGIRVNAVCPGPIRTWPEDTEVPRDLQDSLTNATILKRFGTPEEVANCVLFLASDESSFVTGSCLFVDGGWNAL
jgi:NAD(P)-dependent dehydrogenase (short-subunit alcohol dehydrogenase family)